jgi:PleD family two-component response regulator
MRRTRVLILESVLENAEFVQDALAEAQEKASGSVAFDSLHLECASDALDVLKGEPFDAVLLGIEKADRFAFETFTALHTCAPATPVILMLERRDARFGQMLLRHGLQDFLIRGEFDYLPLARAVENAIERHRVLSAALSVQMTDPLTGLLSARAFSVMAERELRWIADASVPGILAVAELARDTDDLGILECSNRLLSICGSGPLICRWSPACFVVLGRSDQLQDVTSCSPEMRVATTAVSRGVAIENLIADAMKSLCENGHAYSATAQ